MDMHLYRIFNALGDSIILLTYFQHYKITKVYYNRGDFDKLTLVANLSKINLPEFIKSDKKIAANMTDLLTKLTNDNVPLICIDNNKDKKDYITTQLTSNNAASQDRNISKSIAEKYFQYKCDIFDTEEQKTIEGIVNLLSSSKQHVSMDSGTAWLAIALGVDTTVISNNSYYFADAYYYMKYLETQEKANVLQQHGCPIRPSTQKEFERYTKQYNIKPGNYISYINKISKIEKIKND